MQFEPKGFTVKLETRLANLEQVTRVTDPGDFVVIRCPLELPWSGLSAGERERRITTALGRPELPGDIVVIVSVVPPATRGPVA
jgi:hypothetical protein